MNTVREVDFEELQAGLREGSILLVDVREPHEFAAGRIPGSISMPMSTFHPDDLPQAPGRRIVFSCAAGVRSRHIVEACQAYGLPLSEHYAGGLKGWIARGGDVE